MNAIRFITYIIIWGLWAVLGFLFWVPLLTRATASLSAAILYCTVTESDPSYMRDSFENAVSFYARGFQIINRIFSPNSDGVSIRTSENAELVHKWWRVVLEMLWTAVFWGSLLLALGSFLYRPDEPAKVYYERGLSYEKEQDFERAIVQYSNAIKRSPDLASAYFKRAYCHGRLGNIDFAIVDDDQYIKLRPDDAAAYWNRGIDHGRKGNRELAISDIKKSIELTKDPKERQEREQYLQKFSGQ